MKLVNEKNSERFGQTIEVNLLGEHKLCSFDCGYCHLGESTIRMSRFKKDVEFPALEDLIQKVGQALSEKGQKGEVVDTILLSGNGEPTVHPQFSEFVLSLVSKRHELMAAKTSKILCLTNGDEFDRREIREALNKLNSTILKLDAGTEKAFKSINRPRSRSTFEKIILNARGITNLSIQTTIVGGADGLTNPTRLEEWLEVVAMLNPINVYLNRAIGPCADPETVLVSEDDVHRVSHWLDRKLKIKAQVGLAVAA